MPPIPILSPVHGPLVDILILMGLGLPLVLLFHRLGIGALIGYLATGALVGPHGPLQLVDHQQLETLAEIGASLLLFALGLELDLHAIKKSWKPLLIGVVGQMGLTIGAGTLIGLLTGLSPGLSFSLGCCLSLSSTLMVLRALDERGLRHRPEGRTVVGLLLAQDLMLAPLLLLLSFASPSSSLKGSWTSVLAMFVCLGATFLVRRLLASRIFSRIRAAQLPELEVAFAVTVALGAAAATQSAGLGAAVGAFCAGLALGVDEHRSHIETSVHPLQGLMAIIFFVSIGVLFDANIIVERPFAVIIALVVSIVIKAALAGLALRLAGLPIKAAIGCGIMTGQIGEFSFVLSQAAFGGSDNPVVKDLYQLMVVVTCLSLAATPLLIRLAIRFLPNTTLDLLKQTGESVLVAGLGPVGNAVVETLRHRNIPMLLVDRNPRLLAPWENAKDIKTHQGRIEDMEDWLPVLGHRPAAVILTFPVADASAVVTQRLRAVDPGLTIIVRVPYESQIEMLLKAGAQHVICDEQATATALIPLLEEAISRHFRIRPATKLPNPKP